MSVNPERGPNSFEMSKNTYLIPYKPPTWAKELKCIPKYRIQLAHGNTPIHKWNIPGAPESTSIYIKRDDMTGSTLSGNKVRTLEFLLADAVDQGCRHVITTGGMQSNHCRAVAISARRLGLTPHLLMARNFRETGDVGCLGNMLVNRMCGAYLYIVPVSYATKVEIPQGQERLAQIIKSEKGEESYYIPAGGSDSVGLFGYITMFQELIIQDVPDTFDDLVLSCGSGGTAAGLSIANYLTGSKLRCHGIVVCHTKEYHYNHIQQMLEAVGLSDVKAEDIIDVICGYEGKGYGISTQEEREYITDVCMTTGIVLDPTYTGKAAYGLVQELRVNPGRFKGERILFLHTGGMLELFDGKMETVLTKANSPTDRIKMRKDKNADPL